MKTYSKKQIKEIFDKNFNQLSVSEELKQQTLNKIKPTRNQPFLWLGNCAAIFVVTLICLSLYTNRTTPNNITGLTSSSQQTTIEQNDSEPRLLKSLPQTRLKTDSKILNEVETELNTKDYVNNISQKKFNITEKEQTYFLKDNSVDSEMQQVESVQEATNSSMLFNTPNPDTSIPESIIIGDTEEKLLKAYAILEKVENGYVLKRENNTIFYKITNGTVSEIIIN